MNDTKAWWISVTIITAFVLMSELIVIFREFVYVRMGLSRNLVLSLLWVMPVIAAFLTAFLSEKRRIVKALSLVLVLSVLGPVVHYITGELGAKVDFEGLPGLRVTIQIYFVLSFLTIGFGAILGILFNRK